MTSPKLFCDALVADHVLRHATKTHHIIAFALMVQLDRYLHGAHEPLFLQLVERLDEMQVHENEAIVKGATQLTSAVHYACALFASQGYTSTSTTRNFRCGVWGAKRHSPMKHSCALTATSRHTALIGAKNSTGTSIVATASR